MDMKYYSFTGLVVLSSINIVRTPFLTKHLSKIIDYILEIENYIIT